MTKVNIIGIGPGSFDLLTVKAAKAIEESSVLFGDKRMLKAYEDTDKTLLATIDAGIIEAKISELSKGKHVFGILVSGDTGFFSLAKNLRRRLKAYEVHSYCGISSAVYFAQLLETSWDDAALLSLHGRDENLTATVTRHKKVFALTGGANSPNEICKELCRNGLGGCLIHVGERLSYPEEKITTGSANELCGFFFDSLSVMLIRNENACTSTGTVHGLPDSLFIRGSVPMTKQEVRSVAISKLAPNTSDTIYDIGAGTGSVAVELSLIAKHGKVFAFERSENALNLLALNKKKFNVPNMQIVAGDAAETIKGAPPADCVFIGGSSGKITLILNEIYQKNPAARIVITAIKLETLLSSMEYYRERQDYDTEILNLVTARSEKIGDYNLMKGQNPIYIITARRKEETTCEPTFRGL